MTGEPTESVLLLVAKHGIPVHPHIGRLAIPRHLTGIEKDAAVMPWAADNDCFQGLNEPRFRAMLDRIGRIDGCLFVTVPDVVADHAATIELWREWQPEVARHGPPAFVLQDGIDYVPWQDCAAVFVGGSTEFKLGPTAAQIVRDARRAGLLAHMGRVNSVKRMRYAAAIGCTSVDGTCWARWDRTHLIRGADACAAATNQTFMEVPA